MRDAPAVGKRERRAAPEAFASAQEAQLWFERYVHRGTVKAPIVILLFLVMLSAVLGSFMATTPEAQQQAHAVVHGMLGLLMGAVIVFALAAAPGFASFVRHVDWHRNDALAMPAFFAALPLSSGDFVWAKLKMLGRNVISMWLIVGAAAAALLSLTGIHPAWLAWFDGMVARHGLGEAYLVVAACAAAVILYGAAVSASFMCFALLGRAWKWINWTMVVPVFALLLFGGGSLGKGLVRAAAVFVEIAPQLAIAKAVATLVLAYIVGTRGLYSWRRIFLIIRCAVFAVAALATLRFRYAAAGFEDWAVVVSTLAIFVPVLGILGAPWALQWNRSR